MDPMTVTNHAFLFLLGVIFLLLWSRKSGMKQRTLPPSPFTLPLIGHLHLLSPLMHQALHKISMRHGPLVYLRLGAVDAVVASDAEMAKEFLKTHDLTFAHRTHNQAIEHITYDAATPLGPYGPMWIYVKKLSISELLGSHTHLKFQSIRARELNCFLSIIFEKSKAGEMVNVTRESLRFANNIISQMILGYKTIRDNNEELLTLIREVTEIFGEFDPTDFLPFLKSLGFQATKKKARDIRKRYDRFLENFIANREIERKKGDSNDGSQKNFLDLLLDVVEDKNSEVQLTRNHIKGLLMDYLTAGTDSIAVAIEWVIKEMLNNPVVLQKSREEIRRVVGETRIVEETDIPNLPYVQAMLKETLRLHPPIPVILRGSMEECKVREYTLAKNTLLIVNIWSIGRDPKIWKDPLEFNPERFLCGADGDLSIDVKGQHFQLLPFGAGRRVCSGMALATVVLPVAVAALIQCFDWRLDTEGGGEGMNDMTEKSGITAPPAHELVCFPTTLFKPIPQSN